MRKIALNTFNILFIITMIYTIFSLDFSPSMAGEYTVKADAPPTPESWTLLTQIYGYKSGGPGSVSDMTKEGCLAAMKQIAESRKDLTRVFQTEYILGMKAIACVETQTGTIIWSYDL